MATVSSLGTGSGLDLNTLLSNLMTSEKTPLVALQKTEASYQAKISSFGSVQSALSALQLAASSMVPTLSSTASTKFGIPQATVADSTVAYATADPAAAASSYSLDVTSLAKAQRLVTPTYGAGSSASTVIGTGTLTIDFGTLSTTTLANDTYTPDAARSKTITIDSTNNTLGGLRDAINASGADVTASIVLGTAGAQMVLTGKQTGLSSIMKMTTTGWTPPPLPATPAQVSGLSYDPRGVTTGSGTVSETAVGGQVAANAAYKINGIDGSGTSNTVTGMIENVTLNLTKVTSSPTTITVSKDTTTSLTSSLTSFVKAYNDATTTMATLGAYNLATKVAGALQGNSTLRNAQSQVRNQFFNITLGGSSPYQRLSNIGVSLNQDGTLSLDTNKLKSAINTDFTSVAGLVAAVGTGFKTTTTSLISTTGSIPSAVSSINNLVTDNRLSQTKMSTRLTAIEARYRAQFTALDTAVASMKTTSTYLTQQLANLPGFVSSTKN
jgi:flagellar hook-associated protein 2